MKEVIITLNDISSEEAFSQIKVNANDKIYIQLSQNDMVNLFLTIRREKTRDQLEIERKELQKKFLNNIG